MTVSEYANKMKSLIQRVDPNGAMPQEEKVAITIAGAAMAYKPFLYATNPNNLELP